MPCCEERNRPFYIRIALLSVFTFCCGWADVLTLVRYSTFVSAMTGNLVWFGASIIPTPEVMEVRQSWWYYLLMITCNLCGALIFRIAKQYYIPKSRCGTFLAVLVFMFGTMGELIFHYLDDSPYGAIAFAPIFGAVNAFSMSPPFSSNTIVMTGNLHKIPKWIVASMKEKKITRVEPGCILPFTTLLGCAAAAGLFRLDDKKFYQNTWSFIPSLIGIAITAIACDLLHSHVKDHPEPEDTNNKNNDDSKENDNSIADPNHCVAIDNNNVVMGDIESAV